MTSTNRSSPGGVGSGRLSRWTSGEGRAKTLRTKLLEEFQLCATNTSKHQVAMDDIDVEDNEEEACSPKASVEAERTLREGRYRVVRLVGHGTFGEVLKCREGSDLVAVKRVFLQKAVRSKESCYANTLDHAMREAATLRTVGEESDHVVGIRDAWHSDSVLSLALEYCSSDLRRVMDKAPLALAREPYLKRVMLDLLSGLGACHRNGIIHRDVKPSNCLVSSRGKVKMGDFGQATMKRYYEEEAKEEEDGACPTGAMTHAVSTRWYRAPELLYGSRCYDEKVDVWSLGMTLAELVRGGEPFVKGESDIDQMAKVFRTFGTPNEETWPGIANLPDYGKIIFDDFDAPPLSEHFSHQVPPSLVDFMSKFLCLNPAERWSAEELSSHGYFGEEPLACEPEDIEELLEDLDLVH
ncbi:cyclin dependent protein kinase [Chloropicon primus]|uniref:cyclin-dependent kinase n=1 Tax=Chloropicon primus TaxID=1764295 RepID=A0A5B8MQ57_9CHLO|nr:cyclin dependent protein kinase [Chloropicon primus]|eukprot:QDZ22828.1 cyclin dependent protein kinase [Chloropicon primus]